MPDPSMNWLLGGQQQAIPINPNLEDKPWLLPQSNPMAPGGVSAVPIEPQPIDVPDKESPKYWIKQYKKVKASQQKWSAADEYSSGTDYGPSSIPDPPPTELEAFIQSEKEKEAQIREQAAAAQSALDKKNRAEADAARRLGMEKEAKEFEAKISPESKKSEQMGPPAPPPEQLNNPPASLPPVSTRQGIVPGGPVPGKSKTLPGQDPWEQMQGAETEKGAIENIASKERSELKAKAQQEAEEQQQMGIARLTEIKQQQAQEEKNFEDVKAEFANAKIDPGRIWNDPGRAWGMALAGIVGAIGQGLSFRRNPQARNMAMDAINQAIDRDIDAQKSEISKMGQRIDMSRNQLAYLTNKLGSEQSAIAQMRANYWQDFDRRYSQMLEDHEGLKANANAQQISAKMKLEQQKYQQQSDLTNAHIRSINADTAAKNAMSQMHGIPGMAPMGSNASNPEWVPTRKLSDAEQAAASKTIGHAANINRILGEMHKVAGKYGTIDKFLKTPDAREYDRLKLQLGSEILGMNGGRFSKDNIDAAAQAYSPDPNRLIGNPEKVIQESYRQINQGVSSRMGSLGFVNARQNVTTRSE